MTRIELGPVKPLIQQCRHCGRVRGADNVWKRDPAVIPDVVVEGCVTCNHWQSKVRRAKEWRQDSKLLQDRAKGYGPAPEGTDPFAGFREP